MNIIFRLLTVCCSSVEKETAEDIKKICHDKQDEKSQSADIILEDSLKDKTCDSTLQPSEKESKKPEVKKKTKSKKVNEPKIKVPIKLESPPVIETTNVPDKKPLKGILKKPRVFFK